jgi:hypothetical protein
MASVSSSRSSAVAAPESHANPIVTRIKPPSGLFNLRLCELWAYRELLYFFVWRDVKIRYKQTVVGVLWVVLQPLLTMAVFTFFGRLARLPSEGLPYPVFKQNTHYKPFQTWRFTVFNYLAAPLVLLFGPKAVKSIERLRQFLERIVSRCFS